MPIEKINYSGSDEAQRDLDEAQSDGVLPDERTAFDKKLSSKMYLTVPIVTFLVMFVLTANLAAMLFLLAGREENAWLVTVYDTLIMVAVVAMVLVDVLVTMAVLSYVSKRRLGRLDKYGFSKPDYSQKALEYYGFGEEKRITKCYDCFDKSFVAKDVAVFAENGVFLIAPCRQGYSGRHRRDLGCYKIPVSEISALEVRAFGETRATVITLNDGNSIWLGKKTLGYLQRTCGFEK